MVVHTCGGSRWVRARLSFYEDCVYNVMQLNIPSGLGPDVLAIDHPGFMYSKTCQGDHSDKATTCPRRPLQPGPRDAISGQMTLDKETDHLVTETTNLKVH